MTFGSIGTINSVSVFPSPHHTLQIVPPVFLQPGLFSGLQFSPASINLGREGFRRAHAWTGWIILAAAIATARTDLIARLRSSADAAHRRSFFFDQWRARLKSSARLRNPVPALIENFIDALILDVELSRHLFHWWTANTIFKR